MAYKHNVRTRTNSSETKLKNTEAYIATGRRGEIYHSDYRLAKEVEEVKLLLYLVLDKLGIDPKVVSKALKSKTIEDDKRDKDDYVDALDRLTKYIKG